MKCFLFYTVFTLALLCGTACQQNRKNMEDTKSKNQPPTFSTPEEAAGQAKRDLLTILRSGNSINLGLDSAILSRSQPSSPVKQYQLSFDNLASVDSAGNFTALTQNEQATVVPLIDNNRIITIAEVAKTANGWRVAALASKEITDELNIVRTSIADSIGREIVIYKLPHTAVKVYGVKQEGTEVFYTNYPGFSIRQGVPGSRLIPLLKQEALEYQRKFGADLKDQKLLQ